MVKPGGTGRPARVISATPAPLPPRRSRILALPSSKRQTHLAPRARARPSAAVRLGFFALVCAVVAVRFVVFALDGVRTAIEIDASVMLSGGASVTPARHPRRPPRA